MSRDDVQRWKDKYLENIEQQERLQRRWDARIDLLRRGLVRSSLAAEGSDKAVDQCMKELREILRRDDMDAGLSGLIPRLEKAVLDSEQRRQQRTQQNIDALGELAQQLLALDLPRELRKPLKQFARDIEERARQSREIPILLSELSRLQRQALAERKGGDAEDPNVTATIDPGATSGSNGVSLVFGAENVTFELNCLDLPAIYKTDGSIDGGQAFTIQPGTGNTNAFRNIKFRGNAKNCSVGFGSDVALNDAASIPLSGIDIDITAEDCYRAFVFGGAAYTSTPSQFAFAGITGKIRAINCQQSVVLARAVGVDINVSILCTKDKSELIKHQYNSSVFVTDIKGSKSCNVDITGRIVNSDSMLSIGGIAMSGGIRSSTENIRLRHSVTFSSAATQVSVVDFGGGTVSSSELHLSFLSSGYQPLIDIGGNSVYIDGCLSPVALLPGDESSFVPRCQRATVLYRSPITGVRSINFPSNPLKGQVVKAYRTSAATGGTLSFGGLINMTEGTTQEAIFDGSSWILL